MTAEEHSKATSVTAMHPKAQASRYRAALKQALEELDTTAMTIVTSLHLEDKMLPRDAYIGAPGTYARHVYNVLSGR